MSSVLYRKPPGAGDYPARGIARLSPGNIFWAALVALCAYIYWPREVAVETVIPETLGFLYHPELSVYHEPLQLTFDEPPVVGQYQEYTIRPMAAFQMHGRLLHKTTYRFDRMAEISPIDMMLSWGLLADDTWGESVQFSQSRRWGYYRVEGGGGGPWSENPGPYWSNMHMLPASAEVHREMRAAKAGEVIRLKGFLVNVKKDHLNWDSSLSRLDDGSRACEIVLVDDFKVL